MDLSKLKKQKGIKNPSKRVGRGCGSGKGMHTVGAGMKGQLSRSGGKPPVGFEGGQVPLYKRLPHIGGFRNPRSKKIAAISLETLNTFRKGSTVTPQDLVEKKILKRVPRHGVKILANGELEKELKLQGFLMSKSARAKIEKSGSEILDA
ncbi:50S ribosomal protein L15 [candidate division WWE3 bacterium]|nr:50S ribosomal protein L15 [candidate division WWE3 bacterium]